MFSRGLFAGKVAIVTGGGSGIGKAIATELASLDCDVVIASRDAGKLENAAKDIRGGGGSGVCHAVACNIRNEEAVCALMRETVDRFGRIDYLVNNGGGQFPSPAAAMKLKGWQAVIDTNLTGTFLCCREAYGQSMAESGGAIVNIIADMFKGFPGMGHTGAARAAVDNLTKTLSVEWAPEGVRVNAVAPGIIYSDTAAANYADPNMFQQFIDNVPAKRLGTVEEVASAVCFLLSPGAQYITGATLRVDGGASLYRQNWEVPDHDKFPVYGAVAPPKGVADGDDGSSNPFSTTDRPSKL